MRLFDFQCEKCGHRFEELVRSSETGEGVRCPECGHEGAEKRINGFSVGGGGGRGGGPSNGYGCGSGGFS